MNPLLQTTRFVLLVVVCLGACHQPIKPRNDEDKTTSAPAKTRKTPIAMRNENGTRYSNDPEKTEIFRNAGLGLFIHWGFNSLLGTEISWPLQHADDEYTKKYYALADHFNPDQFDAKKWATLAKLAGMEYVVFTAKHHDGYCMFDSDVSDFKITNSPYGKDIVKQVVEAFREAGLLIGLYYSPGDYRYFFETGIQKPSLMVPTFHSQAKFGPKQLGFLDYERAHLDELLTHYGDIFMLWFDGICGPLKQHAWRIDQDIFIARGEIATPEQQIPDEALDEAWESCMTTSHQWSYQPNPSVRPIKEIIDNLIHIRARGGNMLLNVGPTPNGEIAGHDEAILRDLGSWMTMYGESVRNVRPWHVTHEGDIWFTQNRNGDSPTLYAFAPFDYKMGNPRRMPFSGRHFHLKSVRATPDTKVTLLGQIGEFKWSQDEDGLRFTAYNAHPVQMIAYPFEKPEGEVRQWIWGPDWPVAIKITNVEPVRSLMAPETESE